MALKGTKLTFSTGFAFNIFCMFAVLYHMKYGILVAFFFGIAELVNAQNTVGQLLAQWEMEPALKTATWSFNMVRVEDGNTIASRNPDTCLPLASGMKAITTLAAYEVLGKDFRWANYAEN